MRTRIASGALVATLLVTPTLVACDREDMKDFEEGVNNVKEKGEEVGKEAERRADEADTDGQDD